MTRHPLADLRLALRLSVTAGRENLARLSLITVGVGIGVSLLLLVLTAMPALQARQDRTAWQDTSPRTTGTATADGLWWLANFDHYQGRELLRVYVAPAGPAAPVPPGLTRLPEPGEIAASPALVRLLRSAPADQLAARLPGRVAATVDAAGLASPDELVAFIGATPERVQTWGGAEVRVIAHTPVRILVNGFGRTLFIILSSGLLVPVVVLIAMVTRIDAARRERRLAAMRLVGATTGQIAMISGLETGLAAAAGALVGWAGYLAARPATAALVTFDGLHFYPADVTVPTGQLVLVLCGVPVVAVLAAALSLHRVRVTPLGVTRGIRRRRPGVWRLALLASGMAGFATTAVLRALGTASANSGTVQILSEFSLLATLIGLVVAGAWACFAVARTLARFARRAPALMAARRLAADPQATFRAIGGVVLATFVSGMIAGVTPDPAVKALEDLQLRPGVVEILTEGQPVDQVARLTQRLSQVPGVDRVLTVRAGAAPGAIAVTCADLATVVNLACQGEQPRWSTAGLPPSGLIHITDLTPPTDTGAVHAMYAVTRDGAAGEERVRSATAALLPAAHTETRTDRVQLDTRQLRELNTGLRTGTAFVMLVAACSLTVAAVGALTERRRPFALLRTAGMRLAELRQVILLETVLPLVVTVAASAALGLIAAAALAKAGGQPWHAPGPGYLLAILAGLAAALAVTALTLPLVDATTRPQAVRFE